MKEINERTNLPLKIIIPTIVAIVSATWFLAGQLKNFEHVQRQSVERLGIIESRISGVDRRIMDIDTRIDVVWSGLKTVKP